MESKQIFFFLIILALFTTTNPMKRPIEENKAQARIINYLELPKEIWLHIAACSMSKNTLRETCSYLQTIASRKNKEIFLHDQLNLSTIDLKKFAIYYADLGENLILHNILLHGASPNAVGDHGKSLMSYAIQNKNTDMITLLSNNPNITKFNSKKGKECLESLASKNQFKEASEYILSNIGMDKSAALSFFAKDDDSAMVEYILASNISNQDKQHVLTVATLNGSINSIRVLLAHNANPNFIHKEFRNSPLHIAARRGYTNILKLFIENNAQIIDIKNSLDYTPLHCAIQSGYINSVQFLIDHGACITTRGGNDENCLVMAIKPGFIKIIELLLNNNIDINEKVSFGDVALNYAIYHNRINVIRKLLTYQELEVNVFNNHRQTPLDIAFKTGRIEIENLLFENGGQYSICNYTK